MSAGQVTSPNAVIDSTEDPFNPNSFSDVTGRDPETYQVRNDYLEHPGFVGFQLQDRPSISTLRIYNGSDSDDSNDSNIYGTELSVIQTGTPNASQVKVNPNNGWCQTHIDNLNMYFIAVYDSRGTNNGFDSVEQKVADSIGTQVADQVNAIVPGVVSSQVSTAIAGPIQDAIDASSAALDALIKVVQVVYAEDATSGTHANARIPFDDTIPQNTEGAEILTASITPLYSDSYLIIESLVHVGEESNVSNGVAAALFRDSTANALAVDFCASDFANSPFANGFTFASLRPSARVLSGSTAATTFKLRAGLDTNSTLRRNGVNGSRKFGGSLVTYLKITEVRA